MYFQNPPTNFIDKFVLIINPLQMNVNFFLGHQCKILRLTRENALSVEAMMYLSLLRLLYGRRKILRLYLVGSAFWVCGLFVVVMGKMCLLSVCYDVLCSGW